VKNLVLFNSIEILSGFALRMTGLVVLCRERAGFGRQSKTLLDVQSV
jgi:hypothetical protein